MPAATQLQPCYLLTQGAFLPNAPISNQDIPHYLGELEDEAPTREKILQMNGIQSRHYALNQDQNPTHDLYQLATQALSKLHAKQPWSASPPSYLAAGTTHAPLEGPGIASLLHAQLAQQGLIEESLEINSCGGICSASAQALVNAIRAIQTGSHQSALAIGVEQPSAILKSSVFPVPKDRLEHRDERRSQWFMAVFLRSMLSDGAGAFWLASQPLPNQLSYRINWTHSASFAHERPLCMQLNSNTHQLSQDVRILSRHLRPCIEQVLDQAFTRHQESFQDYQVILPHLSSFFFQPYLKKAFAKFGASESLSWWTNLAHAGNTGAASIYLMLEEWHRTQNPQPGQRLLLFIPESGQFNFVLVSLTLEQH